MRTVVRLLNDRHMMRCQATYIAKQTWQPCVDLDLPRAEAVMLLQEGTADGAEQTWRSDPSVQPSVGRRPTCEGPVLLCDSHHEFTEVPNLQFWLNPNGKRS